MRAVNLIPGDERRGAGGAAGRSGGGAYFLLAALALLVIMAGAYVLSGKSVNDKKSELADVTRQADAAEAKAQSLTSYTSFASMRAKRVQTVTQLAESRFDWSHALREVSRVIPTNAWLTQLTATTSPTVNVGGGDPLRAAMAVPALEIKGCTTSQSSVAKMMARMRLIDGVQRVSLSTADKGTKKIQTSTGTTGSTSTDDCRGNSNDFPLFTIIVFFDAQAVPATTASGSTVTASATTAASSSTPASSSAPASTTTTTASGGTTP